MRMAIRNPNMPISTKFQTQDTPFCYKTLQRLEAIRFPKLAFMAQTANSRPFLLFLNQFPKTPINPGHPVAWKKPFKLMNNVSVIKLKLPVKA